MEKEELLKEKVNALNTSEGVKEQIGQLHKDKELLETEKRSLVDEKKDLEEKYSKVTDEVSDSASKEINHSSKRFTSVLGQGIARS